MLPIAVDFDGVIAEGGGKGFGELRKGAKEFLEEIHKDFPILIHTARVDSDNEKTRQRQVGMLKSWLAKRDIPFDGIHDGPGKPMALAYVDDKNVSLDDGFNGALSQIRAMKGEINVGRKRT